MKTNLKTLTNNVLLKVFLAILTIFRVRKCFSQSTVGTISGKAILKDGNSLQGAKVKISELNKTTITDSEGFYQLKIFLSEPIW